MESSLAYRRELERLYKSKGKRSYSGFSAESRDKVAKVMEVERNLAYRRRHHKSKGKRSYPSPLTAPSSSSKKARAVR